MKKIFIITFKKSVKKIFQLHFDKILNAFRILTMGIPKWKKLK